MPRRFIQRHRENEAPLLAIILAIGVSWQPHGLESAPQGEVTMTASWAHRAWRRGLSYRFS